MLKNIHWPVLLLAVLAVLGIATYGVAVAERSFLIAILATVMVVIAFMGSSKYRSRNTAS
ncbi:MULTISPECIES: DUF5325 family protein [unclassified Geomicrobium]|uniref:DUF5325 family protein n=1 Tax=unclassified Geomicrobium TaxID=2628951 RepID=UPI00045F2046|nr:MULTISPECIES: DUF5325 family protein [unclassified Geomicrobium]GAK07376.1 hypothetical protein JCM19038_1109 [Geomicrobium sp. JCM 19038]